LEDIRKFVADVREGGKTAGELPPIVLATLRQRMVALAAEVAEGAVWANGARSHMAMSLKHLPEAKRKDPKFFIGNMVPTVVAEDRAAAAAVNRKTLLNYVKLPNYQNYWIEAGVEGGGGAVRQGIAARED